MMLHNAQHGSCGRATVMWPTPRAVPRVHRPLLPVARRPGYGDAAQARSAVEHGGGGKASPRGAGSGFLPDPHQVQCHVRNITWLCTYPWHVGSATTCILSHNSRRRPMLHIAIQMLVGDRAKYAGLL